MPILPATVRRGLSAAYSAVKSSLFGPRNSKTLNNGKSSVNNTLTGITSRVPPARIPKSFTLNDQGIDEIVYQSVSKVFNDRANKIVIDSHANPKDRITELNKVCELIISETSQIIEADDKSTTVEDPSQTQAKNSISSAVSYLKAQHLKKILHDLLGIERNPLYKEMLAMKEDLRPFRAYVLKQIGFLHSCVFTQSSEPRLKHSYLNEHDDDIRRITLLDDQFPKKYESYLDAFKDSLLDAKNLLIQARLYCELVDMDPERLEKAILDLVLVNAETAHEGLVNSQEKRAREVLAQNDGAEIGRETIAIMSNGQETLLRFQDLPGTKTRDIIASDLLSELKASPQNLFDYIKAMNIWLQRKEVFAFAVPNVLLTLLEDNEEFKTLAQETRLGLRQPSSNDSDLGFSLEPSNEAVAPDQLPPTAEYKEPAIPLTVEFVQDVRDISYKIKNEVLDVCREVLLSEADIVSELRDTRKKEKRKKILAWSGVSAAALTVIGVPTGFALYNNVVVGRLNEEKDARLLAIKQLKSDIEAALNPGFDEYIKQAEDDLKIKKEKKTNMRETYCWYLSYYLERNPTDAELRKELKFFIENEKKIYKNGITMDPEARRLITGFLNSTITSDELADGLLELDQMRQKMLPHPLQSLQTIRAINTGRATHLPGDLKGKVIHDLRDLFTLKEWNVCFHLQEQEIDGEQIPRQQITPTIGQLIGTGSLVHGSKGFLDNFIEANYGREKLLPGFDQPYVSRSRASLQILRQKLEERLKGEKHNYENSSEAQKLSDWNSRLDNISSIDDLRKAAETIKPLIDILRVRKQKKEPVIKGLTKCFVLAQDLESMINVKYYELTNVPKNR